MIQPQKVEESERHVERVIRRNSREKILRKRYGVLRPDDGILVYRR